MVVDQIAPEDIDRLFHALADVTRRDILQRSLTHEHSISDLARGYAMSMTAVQKHVAVLEGAGLVAKRRHGREQRVVGNVEAVRTAQRLLDELEHLWRQRFDRIEELLSEPHPDKPPTHRRSKGRQP